MSSSLEGIAEALAGRRVLVTGASGFIGSHLVRRLVEIGCSVVALVRPSTNLWRIQNIVDRIETVEGDLRYLDYRDLASGLSDTAVIFHLAAAGVDSAADDQATIVETNVMGTLRLLQLGCELEVGRFVYCGSCLEYGGGTFVSEDQFSSSPISEYAASKTAAYLLGNTFVQRYGLPVTSLRPFQVYGPLEASNRLVPQTITRSLNGEKIELTGGEQSRDFVFVEDVVEAFLRAAIVPKAVGGTFNVCGGSATSVREVVSAIIELTGGSATPLFGALPYRPTEIWTMTGDPSRAKETLGWRLKTSLTEGLKQTIKSVEENNKQQ